MEIPRDLDSPETGDPLHSEMVERQVAALAGQWARISEWQSAPAGSWRDRLPVPIPMGGDDVASRVRGEWRGLRRRLDAGEPVLLTLLLEAGAYDRAKNVRQVLATGWSRTGWRVTMSIYDPARPDDDDLDLLFSLAGRLNARLTGGVPIRGFMPVPYDRSPAPVIRTERFDDRSVIGLNRPVRGRPSTTAGRKHVDMVARNERGELVHFRRRNGGTWEGANVGDSEIEVDELHSDPVAIQQAGALHVFARSYAGDLLHLSHRRSWSVTNCTDQKRAGAQFRLAGAPVPVDGARLQLSVLGRDPRGGVVHYHYAPLRGWRAEQVPGDPVAGDPVAVRHDDTIHVVALGDDGRLLHWSRSDTWTMTDAEAGPGPTVRLQGRPTLMLVDGQPHVIGRGRHNRLILLRLDDGGLWMRKAIAGNLAGEPGAVLGPGGLHVMAPTADGGLIHAWQEAGEWRWEDVVDSRPTLAAGEPGEAGITCWGSETVLRAFVHNGSRLRAYTWTPDADWVSDPVAAHAGTPPVAFRDSQGDPHLVSTDGRGTIVHVETGAWREPRDGSGEKSARAVAGARPDRDRTAAPADAADARAEDRPIPTEPTGVEPGDDEPDRAGLEDDDRVAVEPTDDHRVAAGLTDGDPVDADAGWVGESEEPIDEAEGSEEPWPAPGTGGDEDSDVAWDEAELPDAGEPVAATSDADTLPVGDGQESVDLELPDAPEPEDHTEVDEVSVTAADEPAPVLDFEAERRMAEEPGDQDEVVTGADEEAEAEPDIAPADEPEELAAELDEAHADAEPMDVEPEPGTDPGDEDWEDDEEWDSRPPAGLPGLPDVSGADADPATDEWEPRLEVAEETDSSEKDERQRTERPVRRFRWETKPPVAPEEVEPMDLSLLDSWPPPSRGTRRDRSKDRENANGNGNGQDRQDD